MQEWEYLYVAISHEYWGDSLGRGGRLPKVRPEGWRIDWTPPGSLSNELGAQGWEIAGVTGGERDYTLIFKRPKAG